MTNQEFNNKTVVVTGGAQGLGKTIAKAFAQKGASIAIVDVQPLKEIEMEIRELGAEILPLQGDISNASDCKNSVDRIVNQFKSIDVLVNNASIGGPVSSVQEMDLEKWNEIININLTGTMLMTQAVLREMVPKQEGNIINIASNVGKRGLEMRSPYVATNWSKIGLTQTLALELVDKGIRVNAVCPGPVNGPRIHGYMEKQSKALGKSLEEIHQEWVATIPMKRMIEPEEVAEAAMFLASDKASAMTGQSINVTGGMIMH